MAKKVDKKNDFLATDEKVIAEKNASKKEEKKAKKKSSKPGFFKRLGLKIKDVFSELKKVSWPTFPKVVKQTGVVIVVVLLFLIVITAFDTGLSELLKLL